MGIPFYPWFSNAGSGESRRDVLGQKDAVRVRSCWGGMVAFDASFFQRWPPSLETAHDGPKREVEAWNPRLPVRFRAKADLYWDASECCLIHADIQTPPSPLGEQVDTGIVMNPYVRVAYDTRTLSWLGVTRRFERLYSVIHNILNHLVGLPWFNPRRTEIPGEEVKEQVWIVNDKGEGSYQTIKRTAGTGGFCGRRALQVMVPSPRKGQKIWEMLPVPLPT